MSYILNLETSSKKAGKKGERSGRVKEDIEDRKKGEEKR